LSQRFEEVADNVGMSAEQFSEFIDRHRKEFDERELYALESWVGYQMKECNFKQIAEHLNIESVEVRVLKDNALKRIKELKGLE